MGYFYGARDPLGVKRAGWVALAIGTGFMTLTASAMVLFPELLADNLCSTRPDPANAALVVFALQYTRAGGQFSSWPMACRPWRRARFAACRTPACRCGLRFFSYWVPGIGMSIGLGFFTPLEGTGVWIGLATGLFFAAVLLIVRWYRREALGPDHPRRRSCHRHAGARRNRPDFALRKRKS